MSYKQNALQTECLRRRLKSLSGLCEAQPMILRFVRENGKIAYKGTVAWLRVQSGVLCFRRISYMERMKKWFSGWALALLATVMVLASLMGCSSKDVDTALDVAIEVLEVVEQMEAAVETEDSAAIEDSISNSTEALTQAGQMELATVEESEEPEPEETLETESGADDETVINEDGHYTSKEEVALYLHVYGKLPSNYISKKEAEDLGWKKKDGEAGQLHVVAPGMSIGGSSFGNYEGLLPEKKGRKYYECDINYVKGNRGAERIVYSNDGLIFYTGDHYESFEQLYPEP